MPDYKIVTKVELDQSSLNKTVNELERKLQQVDEVKLKASFDTSAESMQQMKGATSGISASMLAMGKNVNNSMKNVSKSFGDVGKSFTGISGELKGVSSSFQGFSTSTQKILMGAKELYRPFLLLGKLLPEITRQLMHINTLLAHSNADVLEKSMQSIQNDFREIAHQRLELIKQKDLMDADEYDRKLKRIDMDFKRLKHERGTLTKSLYDAKTPGIGTEKVIKQIKDSFSNEEIDKALAKMTEGIENKTQPIATGVKNIGDNAAKATSKTKKFGDSLVGSLLKSFSLVKIVTSAFNLLKDSISTASDIAEAKNIADVMFGDNKLNGFVDELGRKFNLAQEQAYKFTGTMASMLKSMNVPNNQMSIMSKNLSKLSGDISSFYNIKSDVAFTKLRSGMSGMSMAMKQLGINMNQAQLDEWLQSKGFNVQYKNLDMASKELVRYNYIMEKTRHVQGDFSRTSGTWANQVRTLSLEWQKFKQVLGAGLIAALTPVLKVINLILSGLNKLGTALAKAFNLDIKNPTGQSGGMVNEMDDIGESADTNSEKVKKFEKQLLGFDKLNNLTTNKDTGVGDVGNQKIDMPVYDYKKVNEPLKETYDILKKMKPILDSFKKGFKIGFGDGDKIFKDLIKHAKELKQVIGKIFDRGVMSAFKQMLKDIAFGFGEILGACTRIALVIADSIVNGALQALKVRVKDLQKFFKTLFKDIGDIWKSWGSIFVSLADVIEKQRPYLTKIFKGTFGMIIDVFTTVVHTVVGTAKELISGLARIFKNNKAGIAKAWSSVLEPISTAFDDMSKITQYAAKKIVEVFDKYLRPQIRAVFDFFDKCTEGFLEGWNSVGSALKHVIPVKEIKEAIDNLFDSEEWEYMSNLIKETFADLAPIFKEIFKIFGMLAKLGFVDTLEKIAEVLKSIFAVIGNIIKIVTGIFKTVQGLFQWIGSGFRETTMLANGLKSIFSGVWGLVKGMFGDTFKKLGTFFKTIGTNIGAFGTRVGKLLSSFGGGMANVVKSIGNFFGTIGKYIGQLATSAGKIGIALGNGIINGIKSAFNTINDWLQKVADKIASWFPGSSNEGSHGSGGSIPRLASGGLVTRSTIANIGERGKEAVLPLNNSVMSALAKAITNNMNPQYAMAGSPNITINSSFNADKFLDYQVRTTNRRNKARGVF